MALRWSSHWLLAYFNWLQEQKFAIITKVTSALVISQNSNLHFNSRMWPWLFHGRATMGWNRCSSKSSSASSTIRGGPSFQAGYKERTWACCWLWGLRFNSWIRFWWRQASLYHNSWIFWLRNWALTSQNYMVQLLFRF